MTTNPIDGTTGTSSASTALKTTGSSALDKDAFLKLLVATMRYQDPSSPMDTTQIMSQTAEMTTVESLQQVQAATAETLAFQGMLLASSLVGKDITAAGPDGTVITGTVSASRSVAGASYIVVGESTIPVAAVFEVR